MTIFDWPATLIPRNIQIRTPRATNSLNRSQTGFTQAVPQIRPPFGLKLEFDSLFGTDVLAYRAIVASLEGRANRVRVPLFDMWFTATDAQIGAGKVPHSDGSMFSDGALYLTNDLEGVTVTAEQGSRNITADFGAYGPLLQAGLYFGLGDQPYIATQVSWAGSVATIRSSPTMRIDYVDQPLRLRPVMICQLADDDDGQLALTNMRYGSPTIEFEEAFDGLFS